MSALICMRHADMMRVHPGQDNTRFCSKCGARVGIYPSGQRALVRDPTLSIVCHVCAIHEGDAPTALAPGALMEGFESIPNPKKMQ
jgi:hypothetical protein